MGKIIFIGIISIVLLTPSASANAEGHLIQQNESQQKESETIEFSQAEKDYIKAEAGKLTHKEKEAFLALYKKWRHNWRTNPATRFCNHTAAAKELEEFPQLMAYGTQVIPSILELLLESPNENFILLMLHDELQADKAKVVIYAENDPSMFEGEQIRSLKTVKLYTKHITNAK